MITPNEGTSISLPSADYPLEVFRSLLFSPGQRQRMVDKALSLSVDAVILDLEDGVPPQEKSEARRILSEVLERPRALGQPARIVRVNAAISLLDEDLAAILRSGLDAVLIPKVEVPEELLRIEHRLEAFERSSSLAPGTVKIVAAIESARGLHRAVDILTSTPRLVAVMFGAEDFALDLGLPVTRIGHGQDLLHARSSIVVAAAIARVAALDQVWLDFRDIDGLRQDAIAGRQLGFTGKCVIHPDQVATVNEVFSPSAEDVELALRVVAAFDDATAAGIGAVMLGGQLVELPIVERAQRTLRLHAALSPNIRRTADAAAGTDE